MVTKKQNHFQTVIACTRVRSTLPNLFYNYSKFFYTVVTKNEKHMIMSETLVPRSRSPTPDCPRCVAHTLKPEFCFLVNVVFFVGLAAPEANIFHAFTLWFVP